MTKADYRKSLKRQNMLIWVLLALSLAYMVIVGETAKLDSRTLTQTANAMQRLFFIWQIYMIWRLVRNRRLLREPLELEEKRIRVADERRAAISGAAGSRFAMAICIALSAAATTASFYDLTVFYTLYWVLLGALALWGGLWLYYSRRM